MDYDFEITKNTKNEFQVLLKDIDTVGGRQDIYFTIEHHSVWPHYRFLLGSKQGKCFGSEVSLHWGIVYKIAEKEWARFRYQKWW